MRKRSPGSPINRKSARQPRRFNSGMNLIFKKQHMDDQQQTNIGLCYHMALNETQKGSGCEEHFSTLACAMNIAMVLCERGFVGADDDLQMIKNGQSALTRMRDRGRDAGRWALDGDGLVDLKLALSIHDAQLTVVTRETCMTALDEVHRRIDSGEVFSMSDRVAA